MPARKKAKQEPRPAIPLRKIVLDIAPVARPTDTRTSLTLTDELRRAATRLVEEFNEMDWEEADTQEGRFLLVHFELVQDRARFGKSFGECFAQMPGARQRDWCLHFEAVSLVDANTLMDFLAGPTVLAAWLREQFDWQSAEKSKADEKPKPATREKSEELAKPLARVVHGRLLYTPERFAGVRISGEAAALLKEAPAEDVLPALNWLLLRDAVVGALKPPPKVARIALGEFYDLARSFQTLATRIARTRHLSLRVEPDELEPLRRFAHVLGQSNPSFVETWREGNDGPELAADTVGKQIQALWEAAGQVANEVENLTHTEPCHIVSIAFSEKLGLTIKDGDRMLQLGNSPKRCLLALAVLKANPVCCAEWFALYSQKDVAKAKKNEAERRFDAAGNALSKQLPHFSWEPLGTGKRHIKGITWAQLPAPAVLREQLHYLAPARH